MQDCEYILSEFKEKNIILTLLDIVKTGKEAEVFRVSTGKKILALKIYKHYSVRSFKNNQAYLVGKYVKKPSLRKAIRKKNRTGRDFVHEMWVQREFYMLKKLYKLGCTIPEPVEQAGPSILMEYLGTDKAPAASLKETKLTNKQAEETFELILSSIEKFIHAGIVHADLSPYNILWWAEKPYIIDFPQSINIKENSNAELLLERDIQNVCAYFSKYINVDEKQLTKSLTSILRTYTVYGHKTV